VAGKRIVICADGTWSSPYRDDGGDPRLTNVVRLSQAIVPVGADRTPQLVYYQSGVGTGWARVDRVLGGGMGIGISRHIVDAYTFLVANYEAGDDVFLFGSQPRRVHRAEPRRPDPHCGPAEGARRPDPGGVRPLPRA
jgi:uncharacterized protein (DUF2235 family)